MSFRVCRVCLSSDAAAGLTSLFAGLGEKAEIFQLVGQIDISSDEYQCEALVCNNCMSRIEHSFDLAEQIKESENVYFAKRREERGIQPKTEVPAIKEERVECPKCDKTFKTEKTRDTHVNKYHQSRKNFLCYVCSKTFLDQIAFDLHVSQGHLLPHFRKIKIESISATEEPMKTDEKEAEKPESYPASNTQCHICNKSFQTIERLFHHSKNFHQYSSEAYGCIQCPKVFNQKDEYEQHKLIAHPARRHQK